MKIFRLLLITMLLSSSTSIANLGMRDLTIQIEGARNTEGNILIAVVDNEQAYNSYEGLLASVEISPSVSGFTLHGISTKPVAVIVMHDEDGNGDMTMKHGYPIEGYGSSGNVGRFSEPTFDDDLTFDEVITIQMYYLN